jgi:hypothetical protein
VPLELFLGCKNQGVNKAPGYAQENILGEAGLSRKKSEANSHPAKNKFNGPDCCH